MGGKIWWMFLWTTLAFWVGCASDRPQGGLVDEHGSLVGAGVAEPAESEQASSVATEVADADADTEAPQADTDTDAEAVDAAADDEAEVQVPSLDRDHWQKMTLGPQRGQVPHWPVYYSRDLGDRTVRFVADRPSPLRRDADTEREAAAVMDAEAGFYRGGQTVDALVAPFKFALDTVLLPARVVRTPPWRVQHTPEQ